MLFYFRCFLVYISAFYILFLFCQCKRTIFNKGTSLSKEDFFVKQTPKFSKINKKTKDTTPYTAAPPNEQLSKPSSSDSQSS